MLKWHKLLVLPERQLCSPLSACCSLVLLLSWVVQLHLLAAVAVYGTLKGSGNCSFQSMQPNSFILIVSPVTGDIFCGTSLTCLF